MINKKNKKKFLFFMYKNKTFLLLSINCIIITIVIFISVMLIKWTNYISNLPISHFTIISRTHYTTKTDITDVMQSFKKIGTFFSQNITIIQDKIRSLPWIKNVKVTKEWPNQINIYLTEYTPAAYWNQEFILDTKSQLFNPPKNYIKGNIPFLYGPEKYKKYIYDEYTEMNNILKKNNFFLKKVFMTWRGSWKVIINHNIKIELGRIDNKIKLKKIIKLWPVLIKEGVLEKKCIDYIDLRYQSGAAVKWKRCELLFKNYNNNKKKYSLRLKNYD